MPDTETVERLGPEAIEALVAELRGQFDEALDMLLDQTQWRIQQHLTPFGEEVRAQFARLREPFPPEQVGKLPRVWCRACSDNKQQKHCDRHKLETCKVCRNRLTEAHLHLDYVGHAAVTVRMLEVDPTWNWRPCTKAELEDLPKHDPGHEMWIALTILGVTRFGIGDDMGRGGTDGKKIMIGDAIRNAALRFGVAIDLWSKEDLSAKAEAEAEHADEVKRGLEVDPNAPPERDWMKETQECTDLGKLTQLASEANEKGVFKGAVKAAMAGRRRQLEAKGKQAEKQAPEANGE
jgi:hypothetical protein